MNRNVGPAKSAARIISFEELAVLARVLQVSVEWLIGQEGNSDPVVWNVVADPNRVLAFANLLQAYEEISQETIVWSRYPLPWYSTEAFVHELHRSNYGRKIGLRKTRPLVEFFDGLARVRRKWVLRSIYHRQLINLVYKADFEDTVCGSRAYAAIPKTILARNLDALVELIGNPSLKITLAVVENSDAAILEALGGYEMLGVVDNRFSFWIYNNGDIGWSEHANYVEPNSHLLHLLMDLSPLPQSGQTIEYLKTLRAQII